MLIPSRVRLWACVHVLHVTVSHYLFVVVNPHIRSSYADSFASFSVTRFISSKVQYSPNPYTAKTAALTSKHN